MAENRLRDTTNQQLLRKKPFEETQVFLCTTASDYLIIINFFFDDSGRMLGRMYAVGKWLLEPPELDAGWIHGRSVILIALLVHIFITYEYDTYILCLIECCIE